MLFLQYLTDDHVFTNKNILLNLHTLTITQQGGTTKN